VEIVGGATAIAGVTEGTGAKVAGNSATGVVAAMAGVNASGEVFTSGVGALGLPKAIGAGMVVGTLAVDWKKKNPPTAATPTQAITATTTTQPAMSRRGWLGRGMALDDAATPVTAGADGAETARPHALQECVPIASVAPQFSQKRDALIVVLHNHSLRDVPLSSCMEKVRTTFSACASCPAGTGTRAV
jgi:hypothetical protein